MRIKETLDLVLVVICDYPTVLYVLVERSDDQLVEKTVDHID